VSAQVEAPERGLGTVGYGRLVTVKRFRAWLRRNQTAQVAVPLPVPLPPAPPAPPRRRHARIVFYPPSGGLEPGQVFTTDQHPADDEWVPAPGTVYAGLPPGWRQRR
jgi:hypothetical protein